MPVQRLSENFFQRWIWIVLPVIFMAAIGVLLAQRVTPDYVASATVNTSPNPLILEAPIGVTQRGFGETVADATARVINERLGTDRFAASVAERAGLTEAIDNGFVSYDDIRRGITVFDVGASLVDVQAKWSNPQMSLNLVAATIDVYLAELQSAVTEDARAAVVFYEAQKVAAEARAVVAETTLEDFLLTLPTIAPSEDYALPDQLQLGRLNDRLVAEESAVDAATAEIAVAEFSVVQAESEAAQGLQIVDPPSTPLAPASAVASRVVIFVAFVFLGLLVALTILLLSTHLDRSVRSAADIEAAGGGVTVAAVPVIQSLRPPKGLRRALGGKGGGGRKTRSAAIAQRVGALVLVLGVTGFGASALSRGLTGGDTDDGQTVITDPGATATETAASPTAAPAEATATEAPATSASATGALATGALATGALATGALATGASETAASPASIRTLPGGTSGYTNVTDPSGAIGVDVPSDWTNRVQTADPLAASPAPPSRSLALGGTFAELRGEPDVRDLTVSGVAITATRLDVDAGEPGPLLDINLQTWQDCTFGNRSAITLDSGDGDYQILFCTRDDGEASAVVVLTMVTQADPRVTVALNVQFVETANLASLPILFDSLQIDASLVTEA